MLAARVLQIAYLATPIMCWVINACLRKRRANWVTLFLIASVVGYVVLLAAVHMLETSLEAELYKHDLDGNRSFSQNEMTAEAQRAMNRVTSDTGRTLAPVTGIPVTCIWTLLNFIALGIVETVVNWIFSRFRGHKPKLDPLVSPTASTVAFAPCNPYQPPTNDGEST